MVEEGDFQGNKKKSVTYREQKQLSFLKQMFITKGFKYTMLDALSQKCRIGNSAVCEKLNHISLHFPAALSLYLPDRHGYLLNDTSLVTGICKKAISNMAIE